MSNKLTRYQQTLLDQVILQSIAESMRDAIKPQLCPTNDLTPLMEINVNVDTIKIENNIFNDADTSKNENKNNVTIRNIEDDLFGTCFYNSDDDTNVWDPLNSSEADSIKSDDNYESENANNKEDKSSDINSSSSPHKNLELNTRRREEECLSPELGVPHPRILRRLKIEFK